eukprot:1628496-Prymnesium_polylepis.1
MLAHLSECRIVGTLSDCRLVGEALPSIASPSVPGRHGMGLAFVFDVDCCHDAWLVMDQCVLKVPGLRTTLICPLWMRSDMAVGLSHVG